MLSYAMEEKSAAGLVSIEGAVVTLGVGQMTRKRTGECGKRRFCEWRGKPWRRNSWTFDIRWLQRGEGLTYRTRCSLVLRGRYCRMSHLVPGNSDC